MDMKGFEMTGFSKLTMYCGAQDSDTEVVPLKKDRLPCTTPETNEYFSKGSVPSISFVRVYAHSVRKSKPPTSHTASAPKMCWRLCPSTEGMVTPGAKGEGFVSTTSDG